MKYLYGIKLTLRHDWIFYNQTEVIQWCITSNLKTMLQL